MNIRHVAIVVDNLTLMTDFYSKFFKAKVTSQGTLEGQNIDMVLGLRRVKLDFIKFRINNIDFELIKYYRPHISSIKTKNHIAITVDNIDEEFKRLKGLGLRYFSLPKVNNNVKFCFGEDIEGNLIELVEDLKVEQKKDAVKEVKKPIGNPDKGFGGEIKC